MNFKKYQNVGLSGLSNLGNTCFVNACIQILFHTYEIWEYFEKLPPNEENILIKELADLKNVLWSKQCVVSPNRFISVLHDFSLKKGNETFSDFSQNDASEFLLFLFETMHSCFPKFKTRVKFESGNDISSICRNHISTLIKEGNFSFINNMFYGLKASVIMNKTKITNIKPEDFFLIHLPIPDKNEPTIEECFDLYLKDELLEGENGIINTETQEYEDITKKTIVCKFPEILIVDLQRFNSSTNLKKKQNMIHYKETLDLTKYSSDTNRYEIYGVINHSGSIYGGHYTCYIKNQNEKWYHYNDTNVKECSVTEICSTRAYCLFYRRI
jgi:ubiquitin C-terminal hydrolase